MLSYHPMQQVRIDVTAGSRTYPVLVGEGLAGGLGPLLHEARLGTRRFFVSSPTVWKLHGGTVAKGVPHAEPVLVPDGERFKTLATVSRIYDTLIRAEADRACAIVGVGGGVIGDMAGFAAATYLRGVPVAHVPTTLLAQVDSAVGGKTGVNLALGKNLVGAFHQPSIVVADPLVLETLPRREFRSGLYEVVKYGMIASRDLFDRVARDQTAIFARDPKALTPIIVESCRIKAGVVAADERESGPRRVLNFGHTVGHALEAVTQYRRFRHGEAVGYGMLAAAELSAGRGALAGSDLEALHNMIRQLGPLPPISDLSIAQVLEAVRRDKKVVNGKLHFVLATTIGATAIAGDVTEDELGQALKVIGLKK